MDTLDAIRHLTGVISSLAQQHALTTSEAQFSEMQSMQLGGGPLSTLYPQMVAPSSPLGVNVQVCFYNSPSVLAFDVYFPTRLVDDDILCILLLLFGRMVLK